MRGYVSIGRIARPMYFFSPHEHNMWEVVYYIDGEGTLTIGDKDIAFRPGTMVLQPPGVPHSENSSKGYTNYHMMVEVVERQGGQGDNIAVIHDNETNDLLSLLSMIFRLSASQPSGWRAVVESILAAISQYSSALATGVRRTHWVGVMENRLVENIPNASFHTGDVYKDIPVSVDHLRRLFVAEVGMTPTEYLSSLRMEVASRLLKAGYAQSLSVKAIASMCGFDDQYYFSRIFRKVMGASPTLWAKSVKFEEQQCV